VLKIRSEQFKVGSVFLNHDIDLIVSESLCLCENCARIGNSYFAGAKFFRCRRKHMVQLAVFVVAEDLESLLQALRA